MARSNSLLTDKAYIDGQWVGANSGYTFDVTNPATGAVIAKVPDQREPETLWAIDAAAAAYKSWSVSPPKYRQELLIKFYNLMVQYTDQLAEILTLENGKPLAESKGEIGLASSFFEWFAGETMRTYGETIPSAIPGVRNMTIKQPIGVVGLITPWNFPSAMVTRKAAAALAAGCTVVVKAPPETPLSALALAKLAEEAGFPKGVFNILTTADSPLIGNILCTHPTIKKISFTGSTVVGKHLAKLCSSTLKKMSFELGGNAPFIVFDDAEVDEAVAGAIASKFRLSGQTCVCANRIYVHKQVFDEFTQKFVKAVSAFKVGNGLEAGTTHGPLIHESAAIKVQDHVDDAVGKGAKVLIGGKRGPGSFFEPTVVSGITPDARVLKEETFGPLAALVAFETEEEVVEAANDTNVGLAGSFFSRDVGRIYRVAEALQTGMVGVNTGLISQAACPFGGIKESGWGKEGSKYGIDDYMIVKFVAIGGLNSRI